MGNVVKLGTDKQMQNSLRVIAEATKGGLPQSLLLVMVDHEGEDVVLTAGNFDAYRTIGWLEHLKKALLEAQEDSMDA